MDIMQSMKYFALLGSEWILWLLVALSIVSVGVMIERAIYLLRHRGDVDGVMATLAPLLAAGAWAKAVEELAGRRGAPLAVLREGLANAGQGSRVAEEIMAAQENVQRRQLNRSISFLGTVGANAPFVGLLGTVLGIIKAFHDLAFNSDQGPSVVMAGISEALVATAIGLLVAIPAVVAFNYFKNWANSIVADMDRVIRLLTAFIEGYEHDHGPRTPDGDASRRA